MRTTPEASQAKVESANPANSGHTQRKELSGGCSFSLAFSTPRNSHAAYRALHKVSTPPIKKEARKDDLLINGVQIKPHSGCDSDDKVNS